MSRKQLLKNSVMVAGMLCIIAHNTTLSNKVEAIQHHEFEIVAISADSQSFNIYYQKRS